MKKLLSIIFISVYSSTAFGLAINYHFCGEVFINQSLAELGREKDCNCMTGNKPSDCCKDYMLYQKADNHETVQLLFNTLPEYTPQLFTLYFDYTVKVLEIDYTEVFINSFIRCHPGQIYLLNKVFRI